MTIRSLTPRIAGVLLTALACSRGADRAPGDSAPATTPAPSPVTPTPPTGDRWVVTEHGIGPLRIGMTIAEAKAALADRFRVPATANPECDYATLETDSGRVDAMIANGRVVRIEVDSGRIPTAEGARVGDTEERIKELYAGRVTVGPHKYEDGHYLTVTPSAPADGGLAIIFETDGKRATRYRAGRKPEVELVEGCS